mgnify:CR=1 FL=1
MSMTQSKSAVLEQNPEKTNSPKTRGIVAGSLSYNEFFLMEESPFSIAPNPRFLYMSQQHQEALAHLLYGVSAANGFVLLTGEVGTGKTTVLRAFLQQVAENTQVAYVLHARFSAEELLETVAEELTIELQPNPSIKESVGAIHRHLLANHANGKRTFLIIDEAQNLVSEVLEEIRLLTNLETDESKLLHIILVGQPELHRRFQSAELRQLNQRITARYHLECLPRHEVGAYIQHRLNIAQCVHNPFSPASVKAIAVRSRGIPRLINVLCDRALLGGFAKNQRVITPKIVKEAANEVFGKKQWAKSERFPGPVTAKRAGLVAPNLTKHWQKVFALTLGTLAVGLACYPLIESSLPSRLQRDIKPSKQTATAKPTLAKASSVEDKSNIKTQDKPSATNIDRAANEQIALPKLDKPMDFQQGLLLSVRRWLGGQINTDIQRQILVEGCDAILPLDIRCIPYRQNLSQVLELNVPFLVPFSGRSVVALGMRKATPRLQSDALSWFYVERFDPSSERVRLIGRKWQAWISLDEFSNHYQGVAHFILQAPASNFNRGPIGIGAASWIMERMDPFRPTDKQNRTLAQELAMTVQQFQREQALVVDGKFGLQTLVQLNRWLDKRLPRLYDPVEMINASMGV